MSDLSFVDLVSRGEARLDQVDDFVDLWHETHDAADLPSFLGMDSAEYSLWLAEPDALVCIVEAQHDRTRLVDRVLKYREATPPSRSLDRWLADHATTAHRSFLA